MIAVVSVEIQAANPSMPLYPWRAYVNSPSSLRIRNVPRRVGNWNIDKVYVSAAYPDNSVKSAECVLVGGIWVCTIAGSTISGFSQNGYTIFADGKDENGNEVTGYVLGKGDITILEADGTITPGETFYYVHMLSAQPTAPKDGDLWQLSGSWYIYQDGTSYPIGDDSGLISQLSAELSGKADISALSGCLHLYSAQPTSPKEGDVWKDISIQDYVVWQNNKTNSLGAGRTWVWTTFERKSDMQIDVGNIVTEKKPSDWNCPENVNGYWYAPDTDWLYEHGDTSKTYYVLDVIWNATGNDNWLIAFTRYEWFELDEYSSWQPLQPLEDVVDAPEDTLSLPCSFNDGQGNTYNFTITRTIENTLGLAMLTDLETKQDKLSDPQISAIDSVVDERRTMVKFVNDEIRYYDVSGELTQEIRQGWEESGSTVKEVEIGKGVTSIGDSAFDGCTNLTSVTIPNSVTSIGTWAFQDCRELTSVTIPDSVTSIGENAFFGDEGLTSVTIPDSVTSISNWTFCDCNGLTNVTIGSCVTSIGVEAFLNCTNLTSVTILDKGLHNLKTIGTSAFQGCSNLISITLPQGVESIGVDAFDGTYTYFKLYLKEVAPSLVPYMSNYPWGVSNTANIITVRNATKEWVEEQAYGKGFLWRTAGVNARKKCDIQPFYVNALTLDAARATFEITITLTATTAREAYFALTLGNFTQPMTWSASFDVFKGGSAAAIAPTEGLNFYHIFEYASGHFMVEKVI